MRSEARPNVLPLHPPLLGRESAILPREQQAPWSSVLHALDLEFQQTGKSIPSGDFPNQRLRTVVLATQNGTKLESLRQIGLRDRKKRLVIGRYPSEEPPTPNVVEAARIKALNAYKMLRLPQERKAFEDQLKRDFQERNFVLGSVVFPYFRRQFRKSFRPDVNGMIILSNDVLNAIPVVGEDGSVTFERKLKPHTVEEGYANLQQLHATAVENGWSEIPILVESATYSFSPHHKEQDAHTVRKTAVFLPTDLLSKILTPEGFEAYQTYLQKVDRKGDAITDVSGGIATVTLTKLGATLGHTSRTMQHGQYTPADIARGKLDDKFVAEYFDKFPPQRTRRQKAN